MSILCQTDFSEASTRAATAAAHLAVSLNEPLHVVHSLELTTSELYAGPRSGLLLKAESRLARETQRLHALDADVHAHVRFGGIEDTLPKSAKQFSARVIVVPAPEPNHAASPRLGRDAVHMAQRTGVPVLIARTLEPFEAWATRARPLRIVLCVDASRVSDRAARWVSDLCAFGRCEVVLAHLYGGRAESRWLSHLRLRPAQDEELASALEREYTTRFAGLFGSAQVHYRIEPRSGPIGSGLLALAARERADLVVVGAHGATARPHACGGSVARSVLRSSSTSAVCVPSKDW